MYGDLEACKLLISHGADLYLKDTKGKSPLSQYGEKTNYKQQVDIFRGVPREDQLIMTEKQSISKSSSKFEENM